MFIGRAMNTPNQGFSEMEKLSRDATDEGAESYHYANWRTLIRRLRRHLLYLREGYNVCANIPINPNLSFKF